MKSGMGTQDIYKPTLPWFHILDGFLRHKNLNVISNFSFADRGSRIFVHCFWINGCTFCNKTSNWSGLIRKKFLNEGISSFLNSWHSCCETPNFFRLLTHLRTHSLLFDTFFFLVFIFFAIITAKISLTTHTPCSTEFILATESSNRVNQFHECSFEMRVTNALHARGFTRSSSHRVNEP